MTEDVRGGYNPGDWIAGRYRLIRMAGEGAAGAVWVATQIPLQRRVAVKVVHPHLSCRVLADRLLAEARAAATLDHPAVVRVFDFGETERGESYIVMELLSGEELRDLLARSGTLPPERAVQMLLPIASGLRAAHELGIVHRDLKPENVILSEDHEGKLQPKLVDFGIAKLPRFREHPTPGAGPVGTPDYMPPEQALCLEIDHRADIWSFCALVYEAIAGRTPFDGLVLPDRPMAPRLANVANVDPVLSGIVERGLQMDRMDRWQSMRDLGAALASWLVSRGVHEDVCGMSLHASWHVTYEPVRSRRPSPRPPRAPARSWARRMIAVVLGLVAAAAIGAALLSDHVHARRSRAAATSLVFPKAAWLQRTAWAAVADGIAFARHMQASASGTAPGNCPPPIVAPAPPPAPTVRAGGRFAPPFAAARRSDSDDDVYADPPQRAAEGSTP